MYFVRSSTFFLRKFIQQAIKARVVCTLANVMCTLADVNVYFGRYNVYFGRYNVCFGRYNVCFGRYNVCFGSGEERECAIVRVREPNPQVFCRTAVRHKA